MLVLEPWFPLLTLSSSVSLVQTLLFFLFPSFILPFLCRLQSLWRKSLLHVCAISNSGEPDPVLVEEYKNLQLNTQQHSWKAGEGLIAPFVPNGA